MTTVDDPWERRAACSALLSAMITHRRHLHALPEVGLSLPRTHQYVADSLSSLGYAAEVRPGSGVSVRVPGGSGGPVRVLRADMDALPLQEKTGLAFSSQSPGTMHACGHDLHTAMLLGAAELFRTRPPEYDVVLAFQPGEESDRGALRLLEHDTLGLDREAVAFAIHVHAVLPAGTVSTRSGTFMAHGDWFDVSFSGSGGHASAPELAANPIDAMADWVRRLRDELAAGHSERRVATVTEAISGTTVNVIPTSGRMRGTLRTLSAEGRHELHDALRRITDETADRYGLRGSCEVLAGYPAVVNDSGFLASLAAGLAAEPGAPSLTPMSDPSMVIEDFAYFLQRWRGAMVYLGAQLAGKHSFNHSEDVDFDESVMTTGLALHSLVADLPLTPAPG